MRKQLSTIPYSTRRSNPLTKFSNITYILISRYGKSWWFPTHDLIDVRGDWLFGAHTVNFSNFSCIISLIKIKSNLKFIAHGDLFWKMKNKSTFWQLIVITGGSTFQKKIINGWGANKWKMGGKIFEKLQMGAPYN